MFLILDVALFLLGSQQLTTLNASGQNGENSYAAAADHLPPLPLSSLSSNSDGIGDLLCDTPLTLMSQARVRRALGILPTQYIEAAPRPATPAALPHRGPAAQHPYRGDVSVCTWNAQALFAVDPIKRHGKWKHLQKLLESHDLIAISETHGTEDSIPLLEAPRGAVAWWAPGTSHRGGVGVVVKESFAQRFPSRSWVVVQAGRAATLRLDGPEGSIE